MRLRISSRSRRFTRLRTTAEPTARLTTKPTFAGSPESTAPCSPIGSRKCPATVEPPARRPARIASRKCSGRLIRDCCGSTETSCAACVPVNAATAASHAQLRAALATTCGEDGPARPGAHTQPETMDLRPPTIVRLERTLAHWSSRCSSDLLRNNGQTWSWPARPDIVPWPPRTQGQPVNGKGDTRTGQTEPSRPPLQAVVTAPGCGRPRQMGTNHPPIVGSTIVEHFGFPIECRPGDLGCGKSTSAERPTLSRRRPREGKPRLSGPRRAHKAAPRTQGTRGVPRAHHVDHSVDNEHDH